MSEINLTESGPFLGFPEFIKNLLTNPDLNYQKNEQIDFGLEDINYVTLSEVLTDPTKPTNEFDFYECEPGKKLNILDKTKIILDIVNTAKSRLEALDVLQTEIVYVDPNNLPTKENTIGFNLTQHDVEELNELIPLIENKLAHRSLFKKRVNLKPLEYPEILPHADALNQSYWLFTEYNYTSDIQNFKSDLSEFECNVITRAMLGISQIEVTVKRFWGDLYWYFQKPEIDIFGATASDSEVRHLRAYSELLALLGMDEVFSRLYENKALSARVDYIEAFLRDRRENDSESVLSLMLFSMFIEHISLFSQFLIIQSFNKERNWFKGMANAISATMLEEEIHGNFGVALYNILREEHPELFTKRMFDKLHQLADQAFDAEMEIVEWIYEGGDLDFLTKEETKNYLKYRYNKSYKSLGFEPKYVIDTDMLDKVRWFEVELTASKENDFFNKRSTDYSKKGKSISADDLF